MDKEELDKRFIEIESRIEMLEINSKPDNLSTVNKFLKSRPDELDKIFQFKLTLHQIRMLIKAKTGKTEKEVKDGKEYM